MRLRHACILVAVGLALLGANPQALHAQVNCSDNGTFGFLTESLPQGEVGVEYVARFVTVDADGPVSFSVDALPSGLTLDAGSGFLTGRPTETFNQTINVTADDSTQMIVLPVLLDVQPSSGGGGAPEFVDTSLSTGRVGTAYADTLGVLNNAGAVTFGARNLPPGIRLDGQTGILSGTPAAAGRYLVDLTVYDAGDGDHISALLPLVVLPSSSDFQFTTELLGGGEMGTTFCDTYVTANGAGPVRFGASGLPPGITLDPDTGLASGSPATPGTFEVVLSAHDGQETITTSLPMVVAPSSTSSFHWNTQPMPPGLQGIAYDRAPPIEVATASGVTVVHSATGLPPGLTYDASTGALAGTPTEVGEFDVRFTASDAGTAETLVLDSTFVVLPPEGGDIASVPVNFWIKKMILKLGEDGSESWGGQLFYNDDRRAGMIFDPLTDDSALGVGSRRIELPAGSMLGSWERWGLKSEKGEMPAVALLTDPSKQAMKWFVKNDTLAETLPGVHRVVVHMGATSHRMEVAFGEKGAVKGPAGFLRPAFVLVKGALKVAGDGEDVAKLSMLLSDPSLLFDAGDTLRVRLLEGATVLVDRDFTAIGESTSSVDSNGVQTFKIKTLADAALANVVKKFSYDSRKGKLSLSLDALSLGAMTAGEAHLTIELSLDDRMYRTGVTFFELKPGSYGIKMPAGGSTPGGDAVAPTTPTSVMASAISATRIDLAWAASTDAVGVTGYKIYRDGAYLMSTASTAASDTGLSLGQNACYSVSAFDAAGNESATSAAACATTIDEWTSRLSGSDIDFHALVWSGSQIVAVGDEQETLISPDGTTWTSHSSTFGTPLSLVDVIWTGSQFVATTGSGWIYTSPDAIDWTIRYVSGLGSDLDGLAWSGSMIVAVGESGQILTSPNGIDWTPRVSGTTEWLASVTWANGRFLAVGEMGTLLTSPDGVAWTAQVSATNDSLRASAWSGSEFVVVGITTVLTSTDGVNWSSQPAPGNLEAVAWSAPLGLFLAAGWNGDLFTSPDGSVWTLRTSGEFFGFNDVLWDGSQFVAAGDVGEIATSPDGVTWTTRRSGTDLVNVTWTGSEFVAVGGYGKILTSPDGVTWSYGTTGDSGDFLRDMAWSGTRFVAGAQTYFLSSANLVDWDVEEWIGATSVFDGVVWSGTQFVLVGDLGRIHTSPDGIARTFQTSGVMEFLTDVTWSGSQFIVVGFNGTILRSPDGVNWNPETSGVAVHLRGVAWSGSQFVAVGDGGTILTSPDGILWTQEVSGTTSLLQEVAWAGSEFVAVGSSNTILSSADGVAWTPLTPPANLGTLRGVAWSGTRLVAVGADSQIITLH